MERNHATPGAGTVLSGNPALAVPIGIVLAVFVLGLVIFSRMASRIAENV